MDEILLRPDQIEAEGWAASDAWEKLGKERKLLGDPDEVHAAFTAFCNEWLCRAQLQKVAEWIAAHDLRTVDTAMIARGYGALLTKEAMQALRTAAEEVRE